MSNFIEKIMEVRSKDLLYEIAKQLHFEAFGGDNEISYSETEIIEDMYDTLETYCYKSLDDSLFDEYTDEPLFDDLIDELIQISENEDDFSEDYEKEYEFLMSSCNDTEELLIITKPQSLKRSIYDNIYPKTEINSKVTLLIQTKNNSLFIKFLEDYSYLFRDDEYYEEDIDAILSDIYIEDQERERYLRDLILNNLEKEYYETYKT
jgi:hypothetical protein